MGILRNENAEFYVTFNLDTKIGSKSNRMIKAIQRTKKFSYYSTMNYFNVDQEGMSYCSLPFKQITMKDFDGDGCTRFLPCSHIMKTEVEDACTVRLTKAN